MSQRAGWLLAELVLSAGVQFTTHAHTCQCPSAPLLTPAARRPVPPLPGREPAGGGPDGPHAAVRPAAALHCGAGAGAPLAGAAARRGRGAGGAGCVRGGVCVWGGGGVREGSCVRRCLMPFHSSCVALCRAVPCRAPLPPSPSLAQAPSSSTLRSRISTRRRCASWSGRRCRTLPSRTPGGTTGGTCRQAQAPDSSGDPSRRCWWWLEEIGRQTGS